KAEVFLQTFGPGLAMRGQKNGPSLSTGTARPSTPQTFMTALSTVCCARMRCASLHISANQR
ncbi:hypothetical protein ABTK00_20585, partial [Acinetobacter baumannii]